MDFEDIGGNFDSLAQYRRVGPREQFRRAFTVLELLVAVSIMAMMFGLLFPAIHGARQATRRIECCNNLRQLGIAIQSHHETHRALPAGWLRDAKQESAVGWGAFLLPYLEEGGRLSSTLLSEPVFSLKNKRLRNFTPPVFLCPADLAPPTFVLFREDSEHHRIAPLSESSVVSLPSANYIGVFGTSDPDDVEGGSGEGVFVMDNELRFRDLQRGLSHVLLVGERTAKKLPSTWLGFATNGEDAPGRVVGNAFLGPNRDDADECEFDSRHAGCSNFVWADGHVECVADGINTKIYRQMATRSN